MSNESCLSEPRRDHAVTHSQGGAMKLLGRGTTAKSTTPQRGCLVGGGALTVSKVARGDAVSTKFATSAPATSYRTELQDKQLYM